MTRIADVKRSADATVANVAKELRSGPARPIRLTRVRRALQMWCVGVWIVLAFVATGIVVAPVSGEPAILDGGNTVLFLLSAMPVVAIVLAPILGGSLWLSIFGLGLRTSDGRPASGARCVVRAAILWTPLVSGAWSSSISGGRVTHVLETVVVAIVALFYVVHCATTLVQPSLGLVDRLARTRVAAK